MKEKAFNIISSGLNEVLKQQHYKMNTIHKDDKGDIYCVFEGSNVAYKLIFDEESKKFDFLVTETTNDGTDNKFKSMSMWMFDPDINDQKDAENILKDFIEIIKEPKRKQMLKNAKRKKSSDNNVDSLFFINRLVNVFPELKSAIIREKRDYESFRAVTFVKEMVLPKFEQMVKDKDLTQLKKFGKILIDMYKLGDLDVRGLVTFVILNSVEGENIKLVESVLSEELKKAWKNTQKLKGKKISPERVKKTKKNFIATTLSS